MPVSVIAISRTLGAGGEDLGHSLAQGLGMRYVDNEIIDRAAELAGASVTEIAKVERRKGLLQQILENLAFTATPEAPGAMMLAVPRDATYEHFIVDVIRETAAAGNVVIVAHGASIPLAGTEGLLRVLVTASEDTRVKRVSGDQGIPPTKARTAVHDSDRARADYFRRFYQLEHETSTNYDLVINTDTLTIDQAAAAIRAIAGT
jgi:cytidylate kinase